MAAMSAPSLWERLRSARVVARSRGILGKPAALDFDAYQATDWNTLLANGSLVNLRISTGEIETRMAERQARYFAAGAAPSDRNAAFLDLYAGLATPALVGRNLVGDQDFNNLMAGLRPGDQLLFIGGSGLYSFKGTGYVRSGVFDRIQIAHHQCKGSVRPSFAPAQTSHGRVVRGIARQVKAAQALDRHDLALVQ